MKKKEVIVVAYQAIWPIQFEALRECLQQYLPPSIIGIEHVGSTSVEGLAAKPTIDIDIIVEKRPEAMQAVIKAMEKLGYRHIGDLGIKGREVFKWLSPQVPNDGSGRSWPKHNLYACHQGETSLNNHLSLRDYLRAHPASKAEYAALKKGLAKAHPFDIDAYIEGKTAFITAILQKTGLSQEEINDITDQNKLK